MVLSLLARYQGAMVGVHAGDSLAAPYENQEPTAIESDLARRGGLMPYDYEDPWGVAGTCPAGRPTDDSILTAALAQSLIDCRGFDASNQYRYFKRAVNGSQSFLWGNETTTFGRTTRTMLKAANYDRAREREVRFAAKSNGSLMRSVPLALWYHDEKTEPRELFEATFQSSMITHEHDAAIECCLLYVELIDGILHGNTPMEAWLGSRQRGEIISDDSLVRLAGSPNVAKPETTNVWLRESNPDGLAGSAVHTLHIAVWSALHATSFHDGIEKALRFGGDTDTQCAVAGGLLGAYYGLDGIPQEWQDMLKGRDRMLQLASQLYYNK